MQQTPDMRDKTPLLENVESTGAAAAEAETKEPALRMVLLGKTGVGKSATGNTILGKKVFKPLLSSSSLTLKNKKKSGDFKGQSLKVVDTPGFFNTKLEATKVNKKITKCISLSDPGPHVFLVVIQPTRFTQEDEETIKIIRHLFGEESVHYSMVLFTHGDDLEDEELEDEEPEDEEPEDEEPEDEEPEDEDRSIDNIIKNNETLRDIISQYGGGYHVFNNRTKESSQVRELLEKINRMVKNNKGNYYTKKMLEAQRIKREELRIVLVGKTGCGKSAAGNTILGKKIFKSTICSSSVTSKCQKETRTVNSQMLSVVDTPGVFDTFKDEQQVKEEIAKCVSLAAPGPHVFLVVIQPSRFTEEEKKTVEIIQEIFGEDSKDYTLILFTHGDDLDKEKVSIKKIIDGNKDLKNFIHQCGGRYHVFNNKVKNPAQVTELLKKINKMVEKNGGKEKYYTNQMLQAAEEVIKKQMEKLLRENPNMYPDEARKKAEKNNDFILGVLASVGTVAGVLTDVAVGAALGTPLGPIGAAVGATVGFVLEVTGAVVKKKLCKVQ